jgi:hypothetical protein
MCNNNPNCNCSSCSQCQSCTQVTPTCNCTTTCTCTTEQFTEECPCGLQSTNCLIYTGDNLQDCEGDDYLFRGTNFNTFLSQLWDTVKCAAAPTTNTINYTGANIRNCNDTATVVATGSSLTVALNNIWNVVKCWYTDLSLLISQKQPVWQLSNTILVGPSQPAPFNTLPTALDEIAKYHFAKNDVIISLETGTYNLTGNLLITNKFQYNLVITSQSGNKADVLLNTQGFYIEVSNQGVATFSNLSITSLPDTGGAIRVNNLAIANINNCNIFIPNQNTNVGKYYISVSEKAELFVSNTVFTTNTSEITKVKAPFYISTFASLRADDCVFGSLGQGFSSISVNDVGSSSYFGNIKFNSIYNNVFTVANNASLYVSGNNNFDVGNNPTGYENTVDYNEEGAVFVATTNSNIAVANLRVKNISSYAPNIQYVDSSGSVLNWTGNRVFVSAANSKILSNLCYFEKFVLAASIDRNAIVTSYASIYTDLAYVYNGYVGQVAHGWSTTAASNVLDNQFYKNPTITNQLIPGTLYKPFVYDQGGTTMSGWTTTSPFITI